MRGRRPSGPEFAEKLPGSAQARERLRVLLETLAGTCRVSDACRRLGISEQRFDQIRIEALQAAVAALEPQPAGRPARVEATVTAAEAEQWRAQVAALEAERDAALIRAELAVTLPATAEATEAKKASRPPRRKRRSDARNRS